MTMTDKEKEIEEMVKTARKHGQKIYKESEMYADIYDDMTAVYEAGYRKADEVKKETAKEIWDCFKGYKKEFRIIEWGMIKRIFTEYGVEVDE